MLKLVILGLKNKETGILSIYDGSNYKSIKQIPFELNTEITGTVSPFPFKHFSSLDESDTIYETHERTYLLIESDIEPKELENTRSGSQQSYTFRDRKFKVLSEFETPFEYYYQKLKEYGENLGDYNATTWVIHEQARTRKEFDYMCKLLKESLESRDNTRYPLDISLDKYTLQYVDFLSEFEGKYPMTFGHYGSISITKKDIENTALSVKGYLMLLRKVYLSESLINYPPFTTEFYKEHIENNSSLENEFLNSLDNSGRTNTIGALISKGFDMEYLFERFYNLKIKGSNEYYSFEDGPKDYSEIVRLENYTPIVETYDPYATYCCYDCDGYHMDPNEEAYDYEVDERVSFLQALLEIWDNVLTEESTKLFADWNKEIFVKYAEQHADSQFIKHLLNLK